MRPTYLRIFSFEIMIVPTTNSAFTYIKESASERELQIGKVRVSISRAAPSHIKLIVERF